MIDTGDLDEPRYQQTNVIVLELLQVQRDQNVDIREALEAERLRIAKEREELELQREKEEAEQMKNRREIMVCPTICTLRGSLCIPEHSGAIALGEVSAKVKHML